MPKKATLTDVSSGYTSATTLDANFDALNDKFDNTLSRDGSTPNAMNADFDMNSYSVINAGEVEATRLVVGGSPFTGLVTSNTTLKYVYEDVQDLINSVLDYTYFTAGDVVAAGHHLYVVAASGATDNEVVNTGSTKFYLQPDSNGYYNALGLGLVADGSDNFDGYTHGENKTTGAAAPTTLWTTATAYTAGDIVLDDTNKIGYVCLTNHTSGTLATDISSGYWEAGAFSGTDNKAIFDIIVTMLENGKKIFIPAGDYLVETPDYTTVGGGNALFNLQNADDIHIVGEPGTNILIDEDSSRFASTSVSYFFDSRQQASPYVPLHGTALFKDITFKGRWSHRPGGDSTRANGSGYCPIRIEGFRKVLLNGVKFFDIREKGTRNAHNGMAHYYDIYGERMARGVCRETNTNHIVYENCHAKYTDDDPFDAAMEAESSGNGMYSIQYLGLQLEDTESLLVSNPHSLVINGIISHRQKGGAVVVSRSGTLKPASVGVTVQNVVAMDTLERYDATYTALNTTNLYDGAIQVTGNLRPAVITNPGEWDGTDVYLPWETDVSSEAASAYWEADGANEPQDAGAFIQLEGCQAIRTLPDGNYTDWGFGYMFTKDGWKNPAVDMTTRKGAGFAFNFDMRDVTVSNCQTSGYQVGYAFLADNSNSKADAFRNFVMSNCSAHGLVGQANGIYLDDPGTAVSWDIRLKDCSFDIDPYLLNTNRAAANDGTWDSVAANVTSGVAIYAPSNISGLTVESGIFRNCLKIFHDGANDWDTYETKHTFTRNTAVGDPAATDGHNASNGGIGYMPSFAGDSFDLVVEGCDPQTTATYKIVQNQCVRKASAKPTSGFYPKGWFVANEAVSTSGAEATLGWMRLTDGSGHTAGTDWFAVQVVTDSKQLTLHGRDANPTSGTAYVNNAGNGTASIRYSDAAVESAAWSFIVPPDWGDGTITTVKLTYQGAADSGNSFDVTWKIGAFASGEAATSLNTGTDTVSAPTTVNRCNQHDLTVNQAVSSGDWVTCIIERDGTTDSSTASWDVAMVTFEFTATAV